MAQNKKIRFGPTAITNAASNMINCAITSLAGPVGYTQSQPYLLITHIHVLNKTAANHQVSMFIGATGGSAAGTEFLGGTKTVPANDSIDWYSGGLRLDSADFLTALADANTSLVFEAEGEIGTA
jgi:hypothetical protein